MKFPRSCWFKIFAGIVLCGGLITASLVALVLFFHWKESEHWKALRLPFDKEVWLANPESSGIDPPRLRMVDDLLAHHAFSGLSRADVMNLLGPATQTDKFRDWDLVYWLGPERGYIRIDSEWLVFKFGKDGTVSQYRLLTD